jgi:hypothetical protein
MTLTKNSQQNDQNVSIVNMLLGVIMLIVVRLSVVAPLEDPVKIEIKSHR